MCNTCGCKSAEEINPVDSYIVDAPLGRGVAQFYSEGGESAVYEPSNEPMGSTPATEPTNENPVLFCSECGSRRAEGCGCFSAESKKQTKSMFTKDKRGRMYARNRRGRIITHNAENESAVYEPSSEPSGESPATEPTNANPNLFGADGVHHDGDSYDGGKFRSNCCDADITTMDGEKFECMKCNSPVEVNVEELEEWYYDAETFEARGNMNIPLRKRGDYHYNCPYCKKELTVISGGLHGESAVCENDGERCNGLTIPRQYLENFDEYLWYHNERKMAETKKKSKSMFTKDKRGRMYARKRNGEIITHDADTESSPSSFNIRWEDSEGLSSPSLPPEGVYFAEHEGLYACSKCKHWNRNPVDGITKCKKCGNGSFKFVKRSEFVPNGDGRAIGSQTFEYNGTPLHAEEDTSFGSVGEGNNFGQMRAESLDDYTPMDSVVVDKTSYQPSQDYGADFLVEKPFRTGAYLSAGLLTGATLFGIVGMTLTNLIGNIMNKEE